MWRIKKLINSFNQDKINYFTALVIRILIIFIAIEALLFLAAYIHIEEPKLAQSEVAKMVISGLIIVGLIYTILTFESTQLKNLNDVRQQKASLTYSIISQWYNSPMIDYSKTLAEHEHKGLWNVIKPIPVSLKKSYQKLKILSTRKLWLVHSTILKASVLRLNRIW